MDEKLDQSPARIIGPLGAPLTLDNLPPANSERWVIRRKAEVVAAVRGGLLTRADACVRYSLSDEELQSWQSLVETHGLMGLRTTRVNQYRSLDD
jgi:hypothetical protein